MTPLLALLLTGPPAGAQHLDRFDSVQRRLVEAFGNAVVLLDIDPQADKLRLLDHVADRLHFPAWFGRNWDALNDALFDRLSSPAAEPAELIVLRAVERSDTTGEDTSARGAESGEAAETLIGIFAEVAAEVGVCVLIAGFEAGRIPTADSPG